MQISGQISRQTRGAAGRSVEKGNCSWESDLEMESTFWGSGGCSSVFGFWFLVSGFGSWALAPCPMPRHPCINQSSICIV